MVNKGTQRRLGATESGLRPGGFPLGTAQSRAAARGLLERRYTERRRIDVICSIPRPGGDEISIGAWQEGADGSLLRFSNIPAGMTIEEAERIVSQPG
jgi:hypothetical protein